MFIGIVTHTEQSDSTAACIAWGGGGGGGGNFFQGGKGSGAGGGGGGGGGVISYRRLMGMCRWMGWHDHDWIDYHGVAFSVELLEWG